MHQLKTEEQMITMIETGCYNGWSLLYDACKYNYERAAEKIIASDVNEATECHLALACRSNHHKIVRLLLGCDLPSSHLDVELGIACLYGRISIVRVLLEDPRVDPDKHNCLLNSVGQGHIEIVRLLLEDGRSDLRAN